MGPSRLTRTESSARVRSFLSCHWGLHTFSHTRSPLSAFLPLPRVVADISSRSHPHTLFRIVKLDILTHSLVKEEVYGIWYFVHSLSIIEQRNTGITSSVFTSHHTVSCILRLSSVSFVSVKHHHTRSEVIEHPSGTSNHFVRIL